MSTEIEPSLPLVSDLGSALEVDIKTGTRSDRTVGVVQQERWQQAYSRLLFIGDATAVIAASLIAVFVRFGRSSHPVGFGLSYPVIALLMAAVWLASLWAARAYEGRFLGVGSDEYKRVGNACLRLAATVALIAVAIKLPLARGFLIASLGLGSFLLLLFRYSARRVLYRGRMKGRWQHRVLVVGSESAAYELICELRREPVAGFSVLGACVPTTSSTELNVVDDVVPILGGLSNVRETAERVGADTIAVASSAAIKPQMLRRLAWELEGSGVALIVSPALTNVAGPRISIRPVAGLPLLHVDEPEITGVRYVLKEIVERSVASFIWFCALPFMAVIAVIIKLTSPGPTLFRQTRVSRHGREFEVLKFRSMYLNSEHLLEDLQEKNEGGGLLFKLHSDPRVTRIGGFLRRYSLDELPQLWNVIRGDMALVGPRPPLPSEVANYDADVKRRLLVKPGMTGLWQVSGRSDLSWEDSVRLDLYYVENWSLALDAQILVRTIRVVLGGNGAY